MKAKTLGADEDLAPLLDSQLNIVSSKLNGDNAAKKAAESTSKRSEHSQRAKELQAKFAGSTVWVVYPAGTSFEVPAKSGFDVKSTVASAYWCEFI